MSTLFCPNGHAWPGAAADGSAPAAHCPVCGAAVLDEHAGDTRPEEPTEHIQNPPPPRGLELPSGTVVAGYEILEVLGRGGMGIVYKARQSNLKRIVALKMIHADAEPSPGAFARFVLEAEAIAQLQHPNIVQIHEIGQHEGRPFFSLEYVAGGSLARQLKRALPSVRQAALMIETLARAIHHAHQRGIVHRDLKPGNILLRGEGPGMRGEKEGFEKETTASPRAPLLPPLVPKITDFGLAKYFNQEPDEPLTQSGVVLGTPSYMAPEQAAGQGRDLGPPADIYALGAILYELLTGKPPFHGRTPLETMTLVLQEDPVPPRLLRDGLPRDLETICLTCLHKNPARRYASAEVLADDLQAFLAGGNIQARPAGPGERLVRLVRRRPTLAALAGLAGLAGLGLVVGLLWDSALAVSGLAILCLLVGAGLYNARLQNALRESKRQNLRAERNAQRLLLLLETTHRLMGGVHPDDLLRLLSETTTRMLDAERATIYLVDAERRELWSKVALGDDVGEIRVPLGQGIAGNVAVTGETTLLADPYADPRFNSEIDRRTGYTTRNMLTLPMVGQSGAILGVFQVLNKRGGAFGQEDVEILASLAASAARAVEHSRKLG